MAIDKSKDTVVHILDITGYRPVEAFLKSIEGPQTRTITLSSNHLVTTYNTYNLSCQVIGSTYMPTEYGDNILAQRINTDHGRITMFILDVWSDGTNTDAHSTNENESIKLLPLGRDSIATHTLGTKHLLQTGSDGSTSLADLYDCYLLHFSIVIGWLSFN